MPMIPVEVDTGTVAITSAISAVLAYGMCWSMDMKPSTSALIGGAVGIGLFSLGIIPIGLLAVFGIATIVLLAKKLFQAASGVSTAPPQSHERTTTDRPEAFRRTHPAPSGDGNDNSMLSLQVGRNEPCLCGSGKRYKH